MPRNTTSDSNKMFQGRNSTERVAISPELLTTNIQATFPPKPIPKPRKLKPVTNTANEQISCSASLDSTSSAAGNMDIVKASRNVSEENIPVRHIPQSLEQFAMHSEESTDIDRNFQSNTQ